MLLQMSRRKNIRQGYFNGRSDKRNNGKIVGKYGENTRQVHKFMYSQEYLRYQQKTVIDIRNEYKKLWENLK